ncbi:isocitrate/isopropylmalate dehydrogenase family protein [Bremerella cremea]|uniref:Isocitrate/homoisocitrate dehydrogenase n=1 Tax=Bremerella cremea TaxID=1031537 RepID=A0A368KRW4_9BACT|nr:isocitrate/isopropylmalate dehydrogenase family protein [Bremerella cremea]RCS44707.1 isocitrate/isopropylmalate dehydrogenase family protein [Bremerella cremea]
MSHQVCLLSGDGIGPEITNAVREVIAATGVEIEWIPCAAGLSSYEATGDPLPQETVDNIRRTKFALKGPLATASGTGFRSVNVALRKELQLYANYRPAKTLQGVPAPFKDVDLIVVRENTEGLYSGLEHTVVPGVVESLRVITEKGSRRIAKFAFETARSHGRKKVTCIHKANILKLSDGLFLDTCERVALDYPDIEFDQCIVDAAAMKMVMNPHQFDVLVMENLFGDILSDLASGLVGGLGVTPSGNLGEDAAVFEAVHGTAPDIAGKNLANPTALLLSGTMMLKHMGETAAAEKIEASLFRVLAEGKTLTGDMKGSASTTEFADAIIDQLDSVTV